MTLDLVPLSIASEYYTADEMVQFRKRKKRKVKEKFKVDDLVPLGNENGERDHGSRQKPSLDEPGEEPMEIDVKPGK